MSVELRIEPQGWRVDCAPDATLREAAAAAGITLPTSCRNGTCRHCMAHLVSGEVRYQVAWPGLSREELAQGWTLPCVAVPCADLVLIQPAAKRVDVD